MKGTSVLVEARLAPSLGAAGRESVGLAAAELARLLDLRLADVVLR